MRLPDGSGPWAVALRDGRIGAITRKQASPSSAVLDGRGAVVLPAFIDAHLHLDKTLLGGPWIPLPDAPTLRERITTAERILERPDVPPVAERARALALAAASSGTLALRTHADLTPGTGLHHLDALLALREDLAGLIALQVVAFPQAGALGPGMPELLDEALRRGADVLGGLDPGGFDGDVRGHLDVIFGLAQRHGVPLDIHLHDHGAEGLAELDEICARTRAAGYEGRVAVSHAFALGDLGPAEVAPTLERLARAEVAIITAATGHTPIPRARELWAAGVRLGVGSDNVRDGWWPYGRGDVLEKAFLLAYRNGLRTDEELQRAFAAITTVNAQILGRPVAAVEAGAPADLVLVDAGSAAEAVAAHPARRTVIRAGRVIAAPDYPPRSEPTTSP